MHQRPSIVLSLVWHLEPEAPEPSVCFERGCWKPAVHHYGSREEALTAKAEYRALLIQLHAVLAVHHAHRGETAAG